MFTKDKEREGRKQPEQRRPAEPRRKPEAPEKQRSSAAEGHRRPAGAAERRPGAEPRRRPAEAAERRPGAEPRRRPAEAAERRPGAEPRRRPAEAAERRPVAEPRRRPAEAAERRPGAEPRRRPAEAAERRPGAEPRRRPAEAAERRPGAESRRRPAEAAQRRPGAESRRNPSEPRHSAPDDQVFRPAAPGKTDTGEDQIFKAKPVERQVPSARKRKPPKTRPVEMKESVHFANPFRRKGPETREPPQGTSYHRTAPKERKSFADIISSKTREEGFPGDPDRQAEKARKRKQAREAGREKLQKLAARFDTPAIVYTQPKPFNRNRLLIQLISVLAVACAFVLGTSIFFKVRTITVSGAETYSPHVIQEASGIHKGDHLLTFGRARASGLITANLPYVKSVRIGIKLPGTVNIDVKEADIAYAIKSGDGDWWLITSEGKVTEQITGPASRGYTQVLGVQLDKPVVGDLAVGLEAVPDELKDDSTGPSAETQAEQKKAEGSKLDPPDTVSAAMRLRAALQILTALEDNDIVGDAATVNVENLQKIELWYGQRYQVNLGSAEQLEYKVACMYDAILQMSDYQTGMLDVSFTRKKDQVIYTPFV